MQELLDDHWGKEEPAVEYIAAPIMARLAAFLIDSFIFFGIVIFLEMGIQSKEAHAILLWVCILALTGATAARQQVGLGKRLLKLRVVHVEAKKLHWFRIIIRTVIRHTFVFNPIIFAILTFIAQAKRKDPQQIFFQDVVTKTKVVKASAIDNYKTEEQLGIIRKT